jgi:hypothetical protein
MRISWPVNVGIVFLAGSALAYLAPVVVSLEATVLQKILSLSSQSNDARIVSLLFQVPTLGLPILVLTYALAYTAFHLSTKPHPLHLFVLLLPLFIQGAWFQYAAGTQPIPSVISSLFATPQQLVSWLAILLVASLALKHARRNENAA